MARSPIANRAGRFRKTQGWIGGNDYNPCGVDFVPAPEDEIEPLVKDLCRFANDVHLSPVVQAAIAHAQFETIHPFDDGNGRTARALVQILLRRRGLAHTFVPPISVALASDKERYIRGLTRFRKDDDPAAWLEEFASAAARSAERARSYLSNVASLQETWRDRLVASSDPRADAAAWALIEVLPGYPVITVAVAVAALERSGRRRARAAVQIGIDQLVDAGVLLPVGASKRNRAWEASGLLDLVSGLETGELAPSS
jgi:fido (protein-threonine AMPylation protein)